MRIRACSKDVFSPMRQFVSRRVLVTSRATMVSGDFFAWIVFTAFSKVGAKQLRFRVVRWELPQPIDVGRIAAIVTCGVEVVSAD